jgi:hypothetical protein
MFQFVKSAEEQACETLLFDEQISIEMGDQRLNNLAAQTFNSNICNKLFNLIDRALNPADNNWIVIYKALLLLHTIILYGSELSIEKSIDLCRFVYPLQEYNSALVKRSGLFGSKAMGGQDYGGPVRAKAKELVPILMNDNTIRDERAKARTGGDMLVPMGVEIEHSDNDSSSFLSYGQGSERSIGAGYGLEVCTNNLCDMMILKSN